MAAISGATVFTPAAGAVMDASNVSTAMVIPLAGYVMAWVYPLYINIWNKELMDSHRSTKIGTYEYEENKEDLEFHVSNQEQKATVVSIE